MAEDAQQGPLGFGEKFLECSMRESARKGGHTHAHLAATAPPMSPKKHVAPRAPEHEVCIE